MSAMEINSSISCPSTPCWISERPFLTDRFHQKTKTTSRFATDTKDSHTVGFQDAIGCYNAAVQRLMFKHKLYQLREERDMKPETFASLVSAIIYYLREKAKAMAGDTAVRSLLEKMAECASNAYLGILVRWVYEGVIDDPYGEFFIAENKSLQKESLKIMKPSIGGNVTALRMEVLAFLQLLLGQF
ncbi:gamma-tubulin complex component 2 [Rosa sericea]